jgi:hypothetical protein
MDGTLILGDHPMSRTKVKATGVFVSDQDETVQKVTLDQPAAGLDVGESTSALEGGAQILNADADADADAEPSVDSFVTLYPLRSYLDGKEIRRAGGTSYKSPKHEASLLIAKGLASDEDPKA